MYLGRIIEYGSVKDVFEHPQHPYTQALLSAIPQHHIPEAERGARIILSGDLPNPLNPPSGCAFRTRCQHATDLCAKDEPLLQERGRDFHQSACLRAQDLEQQRRA